MIPFFSETLQVQVYASAWKIVVFLLVQADASQVSACMVSFTFRPFSCIMQIITKEALCMKCQFCSHMESKVIDSRPADDGASIRRRRECMNCGRRFTTYEKVEMMPLMVIKRDGRRETFNSQKMKTGIVHACDKLQVSMQEIDAIVQRIEQAAYSAMEGEITSQRLGDMVMHELKNLNDVAYVRFAAVYRKFTDVNTFMQELQNIVNEKLIKE